MNGVSKRLSLGLSRLFCHPPLSLLIEDGSWQTFFFYFYPFIFPFSSSNFPDSFYLSVSCRYFCFVVISTLLRNAHFFSLFHYTRLSKALVCCWIMYFQIIQSSQITSSIYFFKCICILCRSYICLLHHKPVQSIWNL